MQNALVALTELYVYVFIPLMGCKPMLDAMYQWVVDIGVSGTATMPENKP